LLFDLLKDSSHKVSAPFVLFGIYFSFFYYGTFLKQKGSKFEKKISFFDIESIHFLNFFKKAQKGFYFMKPKSVASTIPPYPHFFLL
jgi:hypothetical protein